MKENMELFPAPAQKKESDRKATQRPLADRLRPQTWDEFAGIEQIDKKLSEFLKRGEGIPPSLILWGPPGSGKTTLARLIGKTFECHFVPFSAVLGGVKEVREIVALAKKIDQPTLLFIDEIHRFNRSQQDAFLPHVESGVIVLIGATTENPSFYLTGALLSRAKLIVLPALEREAMKKIFLRAENALKIKFTEDAKELLISAAGGDARRLLNNLEDFAVVRNRGDEGKGSVKAADIKDFLASDPAVFYDRSGEEHYNMASAFIKSMRASDPDAALYWGFRMLEGGEDPRFLFRRMMIFASEDIGNADPRALPLAVSGLEAYEKIGLPEGRIPLAQCITFLAGAPKSNRSYVAMHSAMAAVKEDPAAMVPMHLRNASTRMMKDLGYGDGYIYPHDVEELPPDQNYLPDTLADRIFYKPKNSGYEKVIAERLSVLKGKKYR